MQKGGLSALHSAGLACGKHGVRANYVLNSRERKMLKRCPCPLSFCNQLYCSLSPIKFSLERTLEIMKSTSLAHK